MGKKYGSIDGRESIESVRIRVIRVIRVPFARMNTLSSNPDNHAHNPSSFPIPLSHLREGARRGGRRRSILV